MQITISFENFSDADLNLIRRDADRLTLSPLLSNAHRAIQAQDDDVLITYTNLEPRMFAAEEELTYKAKIEAILKTNKPDGAPWKKKDVAAYIARHQRAISAILSGNEPTNPNVRKKLDELYDRVVAGIVTGESYWIV